MSGNSKHAVNDTPNEQPPVAKGHVELRYVPYGAEKESTYLPAIRQLISKDLSEPYSIYVYRYFLYQWGELCFMALDEQDSLIGVIVCKLEPHRGGPMRGYIAMLATRSEYRGQGIATKLVRMAIDRMIEMDADEIALETEVDNTPSLRIYENLGFLRTKRLHRYYLNGNTAFRLILYLKPGIPYKPTFPPDYPPLSPSEQGQGLMDEDLIARQAALMRIEDVRGETHDVTGS
ncbi:N-alpha-acetyltransferase 30 [Oleoguttula mirabilis]|uniref:N-terminal methionine N(alpha)-acetyltransferase NatC n=1 Tax=Oleoguttula mirabilis TaxID=1507867 RepID=A0AAV9JSX7_9PEZI|nr:N-alpha-acetyltransferase 30 [Oleoguttula mirabilis]